MYYFKNTKLLDFLMLRYISSNFSKCHLPLAPLAPLAPLNSIPIDCICEVLFL